MRKYVICKPTDDTKLLCIQSDSEIVITNNPIHDVISNNKDIITRDYWVGNEVKSVQSGGIYYKWFELLDMEKAIDKTPSYENYVEDKLDALYNSLPSDSIANLITMEYSNSVNKISTIDVTNPKLVNSVNKISTIDVTNPKLVSRIAKNLGRLIIEQYYATKAEIIPIVNHFNRTEAITTDEYSELIRLIDENYQ